MRETPPPPSWKKNWEKDAYLYHEIDTLYLLKLWKNLEKIISCLLSNLKQECFLVYWYFILTFLEHFNNITLWTHPAVLFSCSILTYMLVPSFQLYLLLSIYIRCCVSRLCTIYAVMNFFLSPKRRLDIEINILQTDRL